MNVRFSVEKTMTFDKWLRKLKDLRARALINDAIGDMEDGSFGDSRDVDKGLWELRIHFGAGYRIYYIYEERRIVVLLCGGNKSTQRIDIEKAKNIRKKLLRNLLEFSKNLQVPFEKLKKVS
jgi:putative addiction module killer protein